MNQYALLKLPAYKIVQGSFAVHSSVDNMFSAYSWTGRPCGVNDLLTPILYHKGSMLGYLGKDPEGAVGNYRFFHTSAAIKEVQYGTAHGTASAVTKVPRAIMYNAGIVPVASYGDPEATDMSSAQFSVALTSAAAIVAGSSTTLAAKNVYTFCIDQYLNYDYIGTAFPPLGRFVNPGPVPILESFLKTYDATAYEGGELLVLYGCYVNQLSATQPNSSYYSTNAPPTALLTDATSISTDIAGLAAGYLRFKRFKQIVYLRQYLGTATQIANAGLVMPAHVALASSLSPYNVTIRGPYTALEDISATVTADIEAFYG